MKEQIEFQNLIRTNLDQIKMKNPGFSLRAFAKKLELSPSALSEILNGKRKVSIKMAARIIERLNLSPEVASPVLSLFEGETKHLDFEEPENQVNQPPAEETETITVTVSVKKKDLAKANKLMKEFKEKLSHSLK